MCKLTVFTATYNRAHLIWRLYESLQRQTNFDFEWLVVDDGSNDGTQRLFQKWIAEENKFTIRYYYQENQGLICALNKGIELAKGQFFSKIDSDDYVVDNYIENIMKWTKQIYVSDSIYAVAGLRVREDGKPLKGSYPKIPEQRNYVDATDLERGKYNLDADMCEAWKTEVLKNHPFPVWHGEKFAPEQLVLYDIALEGLKIRWYPIPMCICEYQEGGLTLGASRLEKENPMGYAMMYNQNLKLYSFWKRNLYDAMQMTALSFYAHELSYLRQTNNKFATIVTFPFGILLGIRRWIQYSKINGNKDKKNAQN